MKPASDNYEKMAAARLADLYADLPADFADRISARRDGDRFRFRAFGEMCTLTPTGVRLDGGEGTSVMKLLVSIYAASAAPSPLILQPFLAYKDFADSGPYASAFTTHTEQILVPQVKAIRNAADAIKEQFSGRDAPAEVSGDFAFVLYPLPKIALCYIFYEADEEFPASVTCLFSNNAREFLPVDALADVGEHTSRKILGYLSSRKRP